MFAQSLALNISFLTASLIYLLHQSPALNISFLSLSNMPIRNPKSDVDLPSSCWHERKEKGRETFNHRRPNKSVEQGA